jgi:hypothetical protein
MSRDSIKQIDAGGNASGASNSSEHVPPRPPRRRRTRWIIGTMLLILLLLACIGRAMLPGLVRDYVNRTLDRSTLYSGTIGEVQIHLWRCAYSIHDIQVSKTTGDVPTPLLAAKRVDFALQWNALFHGRLVGRVLLEEPEINFVDAPTEEESQNGDGGPWLEMIRDLFPFSINSAIVQNGSVHFRTYQAEKPVDVYLSNLEGSLDNLNNISNETSPLAATVQISATAMDQAKFDFKMTLDPFSYRPTFHLVARLLGLDVTKINDLALTYGKFDFKRGWFDLVLEADCQEGQMTGYVKPLFRDLKVFSLAQDLKEDSVLQFFWQALVGTTASVLKNQARGQFGTLVPFRCDDSGTTTLDILQTIRNVFRNAFVRAYLPRLEGEGNVVEDLQFETPDFADAITAGDDTR